MQQIKFECGCGADDIFVHVATDYEDCHVVTLRCQHNYYYYKLDSKEMISKATYCQCEACNCRAHKRVVAKR